MTIKIMQIFSQYSYRKSSLLKKVRGLPKKPTFNKRNLFPLYTELFRDIEIYHLTSERLLILSR